MQDDQLVRRRAMTISVDVFVTLAIISFLAYLSLQIMAPFLTVLIWAIILAVTLFPLFLGLKKKIGGKSGWAGTIIALIGLVILFVPTFIIVDSIIDTLGPLASKVSEGDLAVPPPDEGVKDWPIIGDKLYKIWSQANEDFKETFAHFGPQLRIFATRLLGLGAGLAGGVLQFALSIIFAAVILGYAEPLSKASSSLAERISSERGKGFLEMAAATVRNVSRGILGVALIQGGLASVGIFVMGLPFPGVLSAVTIASTIVQVPFLVIVPMIIYAWSTEPVLAATIFTAYMIPVLISDNFLKPILMARGLETPMIVILIGVIGGTVSSGLLGLFIGPVILAVSYKMVTAWISPGAETGAAETGPTEKA
jgi:predicted PurR-regulated permease PerM